MKLIQHLERKLSWRKKKPSVGAGTKPDLGRKSKNKSNGAAIKVSDSEFSQYIRFASLLRTVPTSSVPSYEIVSIRTRSPLQSHQAPSPCREEAFDETQHIYDRINCTQGGYPSEDSAYGRRGSKYGHVGPTTVTSTYRRNRIKTNPWCSSPWASRKSLHSTKPSHYSTTENPYESIESLEWQDCKENLPHYESQPTQSHYLAQPSPSLVERPSSRDQRASTYLKGRIPHHPNASYPQSCAVLGPSEQEFLFAQAPSPEFLNESHQICSEISNYFRPSVRPLVRESPPYESASTVPSRDVQSQLGKFDSMETIDLNTDLSQYHDQAMSVWSLADESAQPNQDTTISSGVSSCDYSPKSRKQTLDMKQTNKSTKRKRPDPIYSSSRQSKKVDRLKSQLKEVVHAAIREAKKEDTNKKP